MLLTVESLLELASKVEPRSIADHLSVVDAMKTDGILLPELARLNQDLADEVRRHHEALHEYERKQRGTQMEETLDTRASVPLKSPRLRRKASLHGFPLILGDDTDPSEAATNNPDLNVAENLTTSLDHPPPRPHTSPPRVNYQSMFLAAAIQLLEDKWSTPAEFPPRLSLPPDTLLAGHLRKAKDNSLRSCSKKYVVLTRGSLTYYSDQLDKAQNISLVRFVCREVVSQRFQHKFAFELIATDNNSTKASKSKLVWMAKSEQERRVWVHAIRAVINEPQYHVLSRGSTFDGDCYEVLLLRRHVQAATDKAAYLRTLQHSKRELHMPVEWIHKQEQVARHPRGRCGMDQVFKDLERDKVKINNRVFSGADGSECVLGALTRVFIQVQGQHDVQNDLTEAEALSIVRSLLLSCNRTQSGGDTYEAVEFLYHNPTLNVLCPNQLEADPLEINVFLHDPCPAVSQYVPETDLTDHWCRDSGMARAATGGHVRHFSGGSIPTSPGSAWEELAEGRPASSLHLFGKEQRVAAEDPPLLVFAGKKMHITIVASTSYKVCDLNPQGNSDDDTWAVVDAVFEQSFVYVPCYGVLEGKGSVRVKHKK
ncbi:hypothetical protein H310_12767 [Aphanomyces invadans]|uniref:PH domain-containing protein n=1 Tax=Aphanomyces invadans TaxID=157072 RepID=A0A024TGH8_9STRA|nr:hypothetical protein H310_12767 [Aphanomyces invadans]ETV93158.1 hypothetical protein H310_12767 [Aphanomyces invadans]|eukprot:XP_008878180.1 hypothetical protein H310_12767 [Aphanomyces invadans]